MTNKQTGDRITIEEKLVKGYLTTRINVSYFVINKKDKSIDKFIFDESVDELTIEEQSKLYKKYREFSKGKPFSNHVKNQSSMNTTKTYENESLVVVVIKDTESERVEKKVEYYKVNRITDHNQKQKDEYYKRKLEYFESLLDILEDNIDHGIEDNFLKIDDDGGFNLYNGSGVYLNVEEMKKEIKNQEKKYNGMLRRMSKIVHNYKNQER